MCSVVTTPREPRRGPRPNVAQGLDYGRAGAIVAAVALVSSYELLMMTAGVTSRIRVFDVAHGDDPMQSQVSEVFAGEVAAGRVPSVRAIRARLHVSSQGAAGLYVPDGFCRRIGPGKSRSG